MPTPSTLVKTLNVLPNPWLHIDPWGQPVGQVLVEPTPNVPPRYVGSRIARSEMLRPEVKTRTGVRYAQHRHFVEYKDKPVAVPNTGYYRDRIRAGELVACDEQTAKLCGVKFRPVAEAFAAIERQAIADFDAANGDGAFEALQAEEAERIARANAAEAEAAPAEPEAAPDTPRATDATPATKPKKD